MKSAITTLTFSSMLIMSASAMGQTDLTMDAKTSPWTFSVSGGGQFQDETDLDNGGNFEVIRFHGDVAAKWKINPNSSIVFSLGYGIDDFDFGGTGGLRGVGLGKGKRGVAGQNACMLG